MSAVGGPGATVPGPGGAAGVGLVPLRVVRDAAKFEAWWLSWGADVELLAELVAMIGDVCEAESGLSALLSEVFEDAGPVPAWLRVEGLRAGVEPGWLNVSVEAAYGGDGTRDGAEVLLCLTPQRVGPRPADWEDPAAAALPGLLVSAYVSKPHRMFAPAPGAPLMETVAEVIDTALFLVNAELVERDRFSVVVRRPA